MTLEITGKYINGCGQASKVFETKRRRDMLQELFGYGAMFGTFNVAITRAECNKILAMTPSVEHREGGSVDWKFYLCDIKSKDIWHPAWVLFWDGPDKNAKSSRLEIMSREKLPDDLKQGELRLRVYEKWSMTERDEWVKPQYWFQSFPWSPQKADSLKVWEVINRVEWYGKTVLDIGAHTGYFGFKAARQGAFVTLFEPDKSPRRRGRIIGTHIDPIDVRYTAKDPGGDFDIILYLSVHHQPDPTYKNLAHTLKGLKARCNNLFVELIVPPLEGSMTMDEINEIVGFAPLITYKHAVRRSRSIYHVT